MTVVNHWLLDDGWYPL